MHVYRVPPPLLNSILPNAVVLGVLQAEKDNHDRNCDARVERSRQDVVVLRPPRKVASPDHVLENEPDDRPRDVVYRRCRRDEARTGKYHGKVDVSEHGVRPPLR